MPYCPTCEAEYREGFTRCTECDVDLVAELPAPTAAEEEWVAVYTGPEASVRVVEMRLQSFGIPVEKIPGASDFGALSEFHTPQMAGYELRVPPAYAEGYRERIEEAIASSTWEGGPAVNPEAEAEAEEDYDVRACPACVLYFHETFTACPGCGAELVPAVEVFDEGQAEPERVIVSAGPVEQAKAASERLNAAGFTSEAFEVEGWPVAAVDLPWRELTDRTKDAEALLT